MDISPLDRLVLRRGLHTRKAQVPQCTGVPPQMIIDSEALIELVERTQVAQERQVLARVLFGALVPQSSTHSHTSNQEKMRTFCACCATSSTSEKSYIPSAVSNSLSASTRKMIYLTASSTSAGSLSTCHCQRLASRERGEGAYREDGVEVRARPRGPAGA